MGKREQMIRVLVSAAISFGFDAESWADGNLEEAIAAAEAWCRARWSGDPRPIEFEAWFCMLDRLETESAAMGASDEPRAAGVALGHAA